MQKEGAQLYANQYNIALIAPDTSPRGANIDGENDSYDFGTGAGFYVDAVNKPWDVNYNMYTYITKVYKCMYTYMHMCVYALVIYVHIYYNSM